MNLRPVTVPCEPRGAVRVPRGLLALGVLAAAAFAAVTAGLVELPDLETVLTDLSDTLGSWAYLLVAALAFLETGAFVGLIAPGETAIVLGGVVAAEGGVDLPLILLVAWVAAALGAPPSLAVVVLAYFLGQIANTVPVPGAVSGGMVGVLLAFGVEADLALAAVLAYRAVAIWLPAPIGLAALGGLRRTIAGWSGPETGPQPARLAPVPALAA